MKKTTLIISALLALNISHNANSEPENQRPPAAETAPAAQHQLAPAEANPNYWGIDTKNIAKDIHLVTILPLCQQRLAGYGKNSTRLAWH